MLAAGLPSSFPLPCGLLSRRLVLALGVHVYLGAPDPWMRAVKLCEPSALWLRGRAGCFGGRGAGSRVARSERSLAGVAVSCSVLAYCRPPSRLFLQFWFFSPTHHPFFLGVWVPVGWGFLLWVPCGMLFAPWGHCAGLCLRLWCRAAVHGGRLAGQCLLGLF